MEITFHGETADDVIKSIENFLSHLKELKIDVKTPTVPEKLAKWKADKKAKAEAVKVEAAPQPEPAPVVPDLFELELPKPIDEKVYKNHNPKVKAFTKDEIRSALQGVMDKHGLPKVQEIITSFGVDSISKLDSKRYHELMKVIEVSLQ